MSLTGILLAIVLAVILFRWGGNYRERRLARSLERMAVHRPEVLRAWIDALVEARAEANATSPYSQLRREAERQADVAHLQ